MLMLLGGCMEWRALAQRIWVGWSCRVSRRAPSRGAERSGQRRLSQPTQPLSAQGSSNDPSAWRRQGPRYPSNSVAIKSGRRGGGGSLWQPHEFHLLPQSTCRGCVTRQVPGANGGSVWENNKQLDDSSSFPNKNGQNRKAWPFKALSRPLFPKPPRSLETCPPLFARAATRASQVLAQDPLFGRAGRGDETRPPPCSSRPPPPPSHFAPSGTPNTALAPHERQPTEAGAELPGLRIRPFQNKRISPQGVISRCMRQPVRTDDCFDHQPSSTPPSSVRRHPLGEPQP